MRRKIPGIAAPARTDLPVLLDAPAPRHGPQSLSFSRWLAGIPLWVPLFLATISLLWPIRAIGQDSGISVFSSLEALWRWIPFLVLQGFLFTVLISFLTMALGTAMGMFLGLGQISPNRLLRSVSYWATQIFRNSPWLVLLFIVMLNFPFEVVVFGFAIPVPGWMHAVFGLSLPIMANVSEIVRGAIASVPSGQWEASESLAFSRRQTLYQIVIPQCIKRMIPPWMNWYAILTMATPIVSILGVEEVLNLTRQAIEAENNRPELLIPFYGFVLLIFFAYCYPIARLTIRLERRYALKL